MQICRTKKCLRIGIEIIRADTATFVPVYGSARAHMAHEELQKNCLGTGQQVKITINTIPKIV